MKKSNLLFFPLLSTFLVVACSTNSINDSSQQDDPGSSVEPTPTPEPEPYNPEKNVHYLHYAATDPTCTNFGNYECWIKDNGSVRLDKPTSENIEEGNHNDLPNVSVKEYYIAPLGHNLVFENYKWASNYESAQAYCHCDREGCDHHAYHPAEVREDILTPATCLTTGSKKCIATFNGKHEEITDPIEIPVKDHSFTLHSFIWDTDPNHANAKFICEYDCGTIDEHEATVTHSVTQSRTCTDAEETTYHATYGGYSDDKVVETASPLGHNWGAVTHEASINKQSMTASRVCARDNSHVESVTITTVETSDGVVEEVANTDDYIEYSYTFTNTVFEYTGTLKYMKEKPGHIHDLGLVSEVPATCTAEGTKAHYSCSGCSKLFWDDQGQNEITDDHDLVIEKIAHTASDPVNENIVSPTCTEGGTHDSVVYCSVCHHEMSRTTINDDPHGHSSSPLHHEEDPATCDPNDARYYEYWQCPDCGDYFLDEACTKPTTLEARKRPTVAHTYVCTPFDAETHTQTCSVCGDTSKVAHVASTPVIENNVPATCTEDGHHDLVTYCAKCGYELNRENVPEYAEGHKDEFIGFEWNGDKTAAQAVYECSVCSRVAKYDAEMSSVTLEEATCINKGLKRVTATYGTESESQDVEIDIDPNAHKWSHTSYSWNGTKTEINERFTCEYCGATKDEHPYSKAASDCFTFENMRSKLASNMADGYRDPKTNGDISMFFTYKDTAEKEFDVDFVVRMTRNSAISSMKDLFIIRVDNSFNYGSSQYTQSGDSFGIMYSDISTEDMNSTNPKGKSYSNNYVASAKDNRDDYTSALVGSSFEEDYCNFTKDVVLDVHAKLNQNNKTITVTVTYYSKVAEYENYLGYAQELTVDFKDSADWNLVNSIKFTRVRESGSTVSTNMVVEDFYLHAGQFDHDIVGTKRWSIAEQFDEYIVKDVV